MLLRAICVLVLSGILVAGLWPFHAPKNQVSWISGEKGLLFGKYGSIASAGEFKGHLSQADSSCSLEIRLQPKRVRSSGTILAFYRQKNQVVPFALRQSWSDLVLQHPSPDPRRHAGRAKVYVDELFNQGKPVLVTISSNQAGTTIYVDGVFVKKAATFRLSSQDLTGLLIIGNSPVTTDDWSGQLRGLAIYDRDLTPAEVSRHYEGWTGSDTTNLAADERAAALYVFDEKGGNIARNIVDSSTDLVIPERFFLLHGKFLERPWNEFRQDWNYWKDIAVNVGGFIPLGLSFCAIYSQSKNVEHPAAVTIVFGFVVSLTIEVLQAFLPTRNSGMTDLFTNTLGTAVGVVFYRSDSVQAILAREFFASRRLDSSICKKVAPAN